MMHDTIGFGFMSYGWIFQIIILILFFLILWWMLKGSGNFGYRSNSNETALNILKKRLASGEIKKEEYLALKKELEKD